MFYLKVFGLTLLALFLWTSVVLFGSLEGWWRQRLAPVGDTTAFMSAIIQLIDDRRVGNIALVLIDGGEIVAEHFASTEDNINRDTLFPAASMSKWITAFGVMTLVDTGQVNLDTPVSTYLTRWQLPPGEFDNSRVTVRRLLSHTAGLDDGLGFGDYTADETLPGLVEALTHPRASSDEDTQIRVGREPGSEWDYSGGGYLILQLLIEDVTGKTFENYMQEAVLEPLGMSRSTFRYIGSFDNRSPSYDESGEPAPLYQYAASGATGFVTTVADMAKFIRAQTSADQQVLQQATIDTMRSPEGTLFGQPIWGLGTILYAPTSSGDYVFGHDGQNDPALNSSARVNPDNGDGIVVLASGSPSLATVVGFHWVFWETGKPDFLGLEPEIKRTFPALLIGAVIILMVAGAFSFVQRRQRKLKG